MGGRVGPSTGDCELQKQRLTKHDLRARFGNPIFSLGISGRPVNFFEQKGTPKCCAELFGQLDVLFQLRRKGYRQMAAVYLYDMLNAVGSTNRDPVIRQLNGFFKQLNDNGALLMNCSWSQSEPNPISSLDILVYFLPFGKSVARKKYPQAPSPIAGHDGLTAGQDPRVSEVYVHTSDPDIIAKLTFHEIMHMKQRMGNEMHSQGGLASAMVTAQTILTSDNIKRMVAVLQRPVNQWTGGIKIMADTAAAIASGDFLAGITK